MAARAAAGLGAGGCPPCRHSGRCLGPAGVRVVGFVLQQRGATAPLGWPDERVSRNTSGTHPAKGEVT